MKNSDLTHDISQLKIIFNRRDKFRFPVLFVLMFAGSMLEAIGIGIIPGFVAFLMKPSSLSHIQWLGGWTDILPDTPNMRLMLWASLILIIFMAGKSIFLAFVYYVQNKIVNNFYVRLSCRMFNVYQSAPYEWLLQRSSSELQRNILNDTYQVISGIIMPILDLVMAIFMTVAVVVALLISTSPVILLGVLIIGGGVVLVIRLFRKQLEKTGAVVRQETKNIIESIQQGFGGLVDARIIGCEGYLSNSFRRSISRQARMNIIRGTIMRSTPLAMETVALIGLLIVFLIIAGSMSSFLDAIPMMTVLGVATIRLKQIAGKIAGKVNLINQSRAYIPGMIKDINELNTLEKTHEQKSENRGQRSEIVYKNNSFKSLSLENVVYSYPNTKHAAVNEVSLELKRGESIAFVGSTGCGKSTLVNLILGLLKPQSGTLKANGVDIYNNISTWRQYLGYIPQTIFLLDDTIRANIAFGVPDDAVNEYQLQQVLESAQLSKFITTLPEGMNTIVGERGVRLSGGQRQRIGIARALYFEPEILVMDEATSALDNKTEATVMDAINNTERNQTLIMIAHRLTTVEDCDRLYYLQNGKICGHGTYKELINRIKEFAEIAEIMDT